MDIKEEVEAEIHKSISSHAVDNANKHVQAKHWLMSFFFFYSFTPRGHFLPPSAVGRKPRQLLELENYACVLPHCGGKRTNAINVANGFFFPLAQYKLLHTD